MQIATIIHAILSWRRQFAPPAHLAVHVNCIRISLADDFQRFIDCRCSVVSAKSRCNPFSSEPVQPFNGRLESSSSPKIVEEEAINYK